MEIRSEEKQKAIDKLVSIQNELVQFSEDYNNAYVDCYQYIDSAIEEIGKALDNLFEVKDGE